LSLSNDPLLIVDGIRVDNNAASSTIGVGGQTPSRFNDINPEDIETIDVLKGPAAGALYGTAAANGVIQITTKRGRPGKTRFTVYGETGTIKDETVFPANFAQIGRTTAGARTTNCNLDSQTRNLCTPTPDSLVRFSPLAQYSPFITGQRGSYGVSAIGGNDRVNYYVGGNYDRQQGVFDANTDQRVGGRLNLSAQLSDNWNVQLGSNYLADHPRRTDPTSPRASVVHAARHSAIPEQPDEQLPAFELAPRDRDVWARLPGPLGQRNHSAGVCVLRFAAGRTTHVESVLDLQLHGAGQRDRHVVAHADRVGHYDRRHRV
jgi:TonB-dependent SusC/RagA subfamily outer membrane receptor